LYEGIGETSFDWTQFRLDIQKSRQKLKTITATFKSLKAYFKSKIIQTVDKK